jgi:hypothetical protein
MKKLIFDLIKRNKSIEGYWSRYYGGVNAYTKEQFIKTNGFSNLFFGN